MNRYAKALTAMASFVSFRFGRASLRCAFPRFAHNAVMSSTLSSSSTDAEVWAAYDDNASYEEDVSRTKALAFITACRILARRLPISATRDSQTVTRESLQSEADQARVWLFANPGTSGSGSTRVRFGDFQDFRD